MKRNSLKRKKLRKYKLLNDKKIALIIFLFFFISIGFSILNSALNITGTVTVKKKIWQAIEVAYNNTNSGLTSTNVQEAIDELSRNFPAYYEFGTPTTSSTTDYTTLGYNVFARLGPDGSKGVCINNGGLFCLKVNEYEKSIENLNANFEENDCAYDEYGFYCDNAVFYCQAYSNGTVYAFQHSNYEGCYVFDDGSFHCGVG